jgi:hypothetical protein
MALYPVKPQLIKFVVASSGQQIIINEESQKLYEKCTGINVVLTDANAIFSTLNLYINETEIFPSGFEVLRIKFKDQAPFGFDAQTIDSPAKGSTIKGTYTDVPNGQSYPYTVSILIRLENPVS